MLVVVAESPLAQEYNVAPVIRQPFSYALALVVEAGEQYQLSLSNHPFNADLTFDSALEWVKNQYLNCIQWQTPNSTGGVWVWQKN